MTGTKKRTERRQKRHIPVPDEEKSEPVFYERKLTKRKTFSPNIHAVSTPTRLRRQVGSRVYARRKSETIKQFRHNWSRTGA